MEDSVLSNDLQNTFKTNFNFTLNTKISKKLTIITITKKRKKFSKHETSLDQKQHRLLTHSDINNFCCKLTRKVSRIEVTLD